MANDPKQPQQNPEQREAGAEREERPDARPDLPQESHEGMPGYGQPPADVREKKLPDQKW